MQSFLIKVRRKKKMKILKIMRAVKMNVVISQPQFFPRILCLIWPKERWLLQKFSKFLEKHLQWSPFLWSCKTGYWTLYLKKNYIAGVLLRVWRIFQSIFLIEYLWTATSISVSQSQNDFDGFHGPRNLIQETQRSLAQKRGYLTQELF